MEKVEKVTVLFQFPSNGKVYPKPVRCLQPSNNRDTVSIPFKREGVSKDACVKQIEQLP